MRYATILRSLLLVAAVMAAVGSPDPARSAESDEAQVKAAAAAFHAALSAGSGVAALRLLAPDAVILEGGELETRQQYQDHHLAVDIRFAQATKTVRTAVSATVSGDVAWVSSVGTTSGTFQGKNISLGGAELMVLTKSPSGWLIRAIHWSSHEHR
jgi:ketosteroid isomerase-like protein